MSDFDNQMAKVSSYDGFVASLDQSNIDYVSKLYGIPEDVKNMLSEDSMLNVIYRMYERILMCRVFQCDRVIGSIVLPSMLNRKINNMPLPRYMWQVKSIVPFLILDDGLQPEADGVQRMTDIYIHNFDSMLIRAKLAGIFGITMRSLIRKANAKGIRSIVEQQFKRGKRISSAGLIPVLQVEVCISHESPHKADAEGMIRVSLLDALNNNLDPSERYIVKLTLPSFTNLYKQIDNHPNVIRMLALEEHDSIPGVGIYNRQDVPISSKQRSLCKQNSMVPSFSLSILMNGLTYEMNDEEFEEKLNKSIGTIYQPYEDNPTTTKATVGYHQSSPPLIPTAAAAAATATASSVRTAATAMTGTTRPLNEINIGGDIHHHTAAVAAAGPPPPPQQQQIPTSTNTNFVSNIPYHAPVAGSAAGPPPQQQQQYHQQSYPTTPHLMAVQEPLSQTISPSDGSSSISSPTSTAAFNPTIVQLKKPPPPYHHQHHHLPPNR